MAVKEMQDKANLELRRRYDKEEEIWEDYD